MFRGPQPPPCRHRAHRSSTDPRNALKTMASTARRAACPAALPSQSAAVSGVPADRWCDGDQVPPFPRRRRCKGRARGGDEATSAARGNGARRNERPEVARSRSWREALETSGEHTSSRAVPDRGAKRRGSPIRENTGNTGPDAPEPGTAGNTIRRPRGKDRAEPPARTNRKARESR